MRFTPDKRLIDLMVGQLFYNSPDAAMRELVQNAEDACALQQLEDPTYQPRIVVRYSVNENWVEVADNGLGMNEEAVEQSFAAVGASKDNVSHIREILKRAPDDRSRQIAFFGVGILSCFGVADSLVVRTRMDNDPGLAFRVVDYHEDFQHEGSPPTDRGSIIRLNLKPGGPMRADQVLEAVRRYARHAQHVELQNADSGERHTLREQWEASELPGAIRVQGEEVRDGYLALDPAWDGAGETLQARLVVCNGGFLVRDRELELLPQQAIGYTGELDFVPQALTIQLTREGFVRDDKWSQMTQRMTAIYNRAIRAKIDEWNRMAEENVREALDRGIERGVLLLRRGPTHGILESDILGQLDQLLPAVLHMRVRGSPQPTSARTLLERASQRGVIYYTREDAGQHQFQHSLQEGGGRVQVTEIAQTEDLRATHLQAKGAVVLTCRQRNYNYEMGGSAQKLSLHEADLMNEACQKAGIRLVEVHAASPEDVALTGAEQSALLSDLLDLGEPLKLVSLDGVNDRVIRDFAGRLLNCRHPEVRELLGVLPDAVGNPVRRLLLQIYMDLQSYRFEDARRKTMQLLTMEDLSEQAQLTTGELLRDFLRSRLQPLLIDPKPEP